MHQSNIFTTLKLIKPFCLSIQLPSINLQVPPKSIIYLPQPNQPIFSTQSSELASPFSKVLKNRSKSTALIKVDSADLKNAPEDDNLKVVSQQLLNHYQQFKDKIVQRKLERMKSQRSDSMPTKGQKQIDYSRNQKIFKEHLKNIVRRKIVFERKHFKILKNLNNRQHPHAAQPNNKGSQRYQDKDKNPIDNYFDF